MRCTEFLASNQVWARDCGLINLNGRIFRIWIGDWEYKGRRYLVISYSLMAEDRDAGGTEFVEFIGFLGFLE